MQAIDREKQRGSADPDRLTQVLFLAYGLVMVWVLLFKLGVQFSYMAERRVNLFPFRDAFAGHGRLDLPEIILNVLIFVPLGVYAGILFRRWTFGAKVGFFIMVSMFFEALQYIFRIGAFDATDAATNSLGGVVGLLLFTLLDRLFNNPVRVQRFLNMLAAFGTAIVIVLLVLLKLNLLPIRYQ